MHCVKCGSEKIVLLGETHHYVNIDRGDNMIIEMYGCWGCEAVCWEQDLESEIGCVNVKANS